MVSKHHSRDLVLGLDVGRALTQGHLNTSGAPVDKVGKFSLANSLQRFVNLSRVDLTLDNIKD